MKELHLRTKDLHRLKVKGWKGQIPYDLTFNWNIINRRKKQTKYNQRQSEVKNNLTIARGEWGGDSGKRGLQELL